MRTVQMTFDEKLLIQVDKVVNNLNTNRSAFTREALREAIKKYKCIQLEKKHIKGYQKHPIVSGEFDIWENEQEWVE